MIVCVTATEDQNKRAPSGFTGVRGKKLMPDVAYVDFKNAFAEKRAPGFVGMPFPEALYQEPEATYKRAPSGFLGMRGKKDMELANYGERLQNLRFAYNN